MVAAAPAMPPPGPVRLFTVAEYDRMVRGGYLTDNDRVELLDGWIVEKMPHNAPHDSAVYKLQVRLMQALGPAWVVRGQSAVTLSASVPEPDIAVAPGPDSRYDAARPTPKDLALVAEVSDATLARDQGRKQAIYARAKIPVYWIVNLQDRWVEVYTDPRGGKSPTYRTRTDYAPGAAVPVTVAGKVVGTVPVSELLP
jgi:Uma2 family endonuclease